jgi:hypothetical protein
MTPIPTHPKQPAAEPLPPFPFDQPEALVLPAQVAEFRLTTVNTLAWERCKGIGIPYRKIGKRVLYRAGDVMDYVAARVVDPVAKGQTA